MTMRRIAGLCFGILLGLSSAMSSSAAEKTAVAKLLFCAYGSLGGFQPASTSPDVERTFAEAVVEINTSGILNGATVTKFSLFDEAGNETKFQRVVSIEDFNELHVPGEGSFGYYLRLAHAGGTQPWNGTLLGGMNHLRIRVSFASAEYQTSPPEYPTSPRRCALTFGPYVMDGPTDGRWAS